MSVVQLKMTAIRCNKTGNKTAQGKTVKSKMLLHLSMYTGYR